MHTRIGIPTAELQERRERLLEHAGGLGLGGVVLFEADYIRYFTNFNFLATERPVAVAVSASGELTAFVPEFEVERVQEETEFEHVASYPEYPGEEHPLRILARVLADAGIAGPVGADGDGYPGILGYEGPALSEVTGHAVAPLAGVIEGMMARKSDAEIELIRESGRWCSYAHRILQEHSRPGATEAQASLRAGHDATLAMLDELGSAFDGQQASSDGVSAGYRGQIGRRSSWAHAVAHNIEFQAGDVLVTETSAPIWGYNAELERAMIIGPPTDEMRRLFDHTVAAQQVAFDVLRPGRHLRGRRRRCPALLRGQRPAAVLAPARRPRHRAAQSRGAVPRRRRPHGGRARDGVHDRAGPLLERDRRVPPLRHGRGHARRHRDPHRLPERHREPDDPGVNVSGLPSGTVTFVFSDIEGSTGLLKQLGDGYGGVLADHRRLVREAFARHDGTEIDTQGDAFFFAFARARDAVAAAVEAQRAHAEHAWPEDAAVRVRMGLHTGEPALGEEGYLGLDVVRAARLCTAGRGGHVLLSETTRALLGSSLPEGVSSRRSASDSSRISTSRSGSTSSRSTASSSPRTRPVRPRRRPRPARRARRARSTGSSAARISRAS